MSAEPSAVGMMAEPSGRRTTRARVPPERAAALAVTPGSDRRRSHCGRAAAAAAARLGRVTENRSQINRL